jgi:hypothetical protein
MFILIIVNFGYPGNVFADSRVKNKEEAESLILKQFPAVESAIYLYNNEVRPKTIITHALDTENNNSPLTITIDKPGWLFIMDDTPYANFAHPIRIGLLDSNTGTIEIKKDTFNWWPNILGGWNKNIPFFIKSSMFTYINEEKPNRSEGESKGIYHCGERIFCDSPFPCADELTCADILIGKPDQPLKNFWAIIVCGGFASSDKLAFAKDTDCMYSVLRGYGVPKENIYYFLPADVKEEIVKYAAEGNQFRFQNTGEAKKDFYKDAIMEAFSDIAEKINKKIGKFLFLISSHGDKQFVAIDINKDYWEKITLSMLKPRVDAIQCKSKYILIDACFSGSFAGLFNNPQTGSNPLYVITSARDNEFSYPDIDDDSADSGENNADRGTEFMGGFIEAFTNGDADCHLGDDENRVSLGEAFDYACARSYNTNKNCSKGKVCNHPYLRTNLTNSDAQYNEFPF